MVWLLIERLYAANIDDNLLNDEDSLCSDCNFSVWGNELAWQWLMISINASKETSQSLIPYITVWLLVYAGGNSEIP